MHQSSLTYVIPHHSSSPLPLTDSYQSHHNISWTTHIPSNPTNNIHSDTKNNIHSDSKEPSHPVHPCSLPTYLKLSLKWHIPSHIAHFWILRNTYPTIPYPPLSNLIRCNDMAPRITEYHHLYPFQRQQTTLSSTGHTRQHSTRTHPKYTWPVQQHKRFSSIKNQKITHTHTAYLN